MIDHRRVQRALFLAQLSPACARALFGDGGPSGAVGLPAQDSSTGAGELPAKSASTGAGELDLDPDAFGLGPGELALLRALDPLAVAADRDGKRTDQLLGNATSEFQITRVLARRGDPRFVEAFLDHATFHAAILEATPLPLAFGRYASEVAARTGPPRLAELVALERAMAEARRRVARAAAPAPGVVALAPDASLIVVADGTVERAARLRAALDRGEDLGAGDDGAHATDPAGDDAPREDVLLVVHDRPRHGLPEISVERLEPLVAALLHAASRQREPFDETRRTAFAEAHAIERADLEAFVADLVDEGLLVRGD